MYKSAASAMPVSTAIVRSAITVSARGMSQRLPSSSSRQDAFILAPLTHVVSHHKKDRGQCCQRYEPRQRRSTSRIRSSVTACTMPKQAFGARR